MHQVHHRQPQYKLLTLTFVVGTIKYIWSDCHSKVSYRKPINILRFLIVRNLGVLRYILIPRINILIMKNSSDLVTILYMCTCLSLIFY
jgi:hypothetical protein